MKLQKFLLSASDELARQFQFHHSLNTLYTQIIDKRLTGIDFFMMTPQSLLTYLSVSPDQELLEALQQFKNTIFDEVVLDIMHCNVYDAVVLEDTENHIVLCSTWHNPSIFNVQKDNIQNLNSIQSMMQKGLKIQVLFSQDNIFLYIGSSPSFQYLSQAANYIEDFISLDIEEQRIRTKFESLVEPSTTPFQMDTLPFESLHDTNPPGIPQWDSQPLFYEQPSWQKPSISQHPSQQSIRIQPSFSGISLTNKPILIVPEPEFTKIRMRGRVDFLIEQVGAIIVPSFNSLGQYQPHEIEDIRNYNMSSGIGLLVCFNLGWFTQIGQDVPSRGDIVEFELVPGYGYSDQHANIGDSTSSTYPFINNFEENKNNKIGQIQKRQQLFATEIDDFYKNNDFEMHEQITCSADKIQVIDRVSKPEIAKNLMIHGNIYEGIIYTYSDQDNYGFIKSVGLLQEAHSYSQGFEVYFKIQPQKANYIPTRGDFVTFKSHWVDDKAQARDIKYSSTRISETFNGKCIAFYPPFVLFSCESDCENLSNNLFFSKWKSIPQSVRQTLILGSKVQYQIDTDISTQFRAIILAPESKKLGSFSLTQSPSQFVKVCTENPFTSQLFLTKIQPIPFIKTKVSYLKQMKQNLVPRAITSISPIIYAGMELPDMDQIICNSQLTLGQTVFLNLEMAIQVSIGTNMYNLHYHSISEEYVFFRTLESNLCLGITRANVPVWIVGFGSMINASWVWRLEELVQSGQFETEDQLFNAILIDGVFQFAKSM